MCTKTICEPGIARGAFDLATRGTGLSVTVWPDKTKQLRDTPRLHIRGTPFWQQELSLLYIEAAPLIDEWESKERWRKLWAKVQDIPEVEAIEQ